MTKMEESENSEKEESNPTEEPKTQESEDLVMSSSNMEKRLTEAYSKNEDLQSKYLRAFADLENLKKRSIRDREEAIKRARLQLLEDLLPVIDAFKMGMDEATKADPTSPIVNGFKMAIIQMEKTLDEYGLVCIDEVGGLFDPKLQEAISYENGEQDDLVVKIIRKGYRLKDHLIRPASVIVSRKVENNQVP